MNEKKNLKKPFISIITVCLNEVKSINKTIQSIISQKSNNYEWIVIDGGSTDGTLNILKQYKKNIKILISENDTGIYNAMNKGIRLSKGEYLLFLNAGDYLYNNKVISYISNLKLNSGIIYGDLFLKTLQYVLSFKNVKIDKYFFFKTSFPHQAAFIKKELFLKHGFYAENFKISSDFDFFIREIIKYKTRIKHVPIIISVYDMNGISSRKKFLELQIKEQRKIKKKYYGIKYYYYFIYSQFRLIIIKLIFKIKNLLLIGKMKKK